MKRVIKALLLLLSAALILPAAAVSADQDENIKRPIIAIPTLMIRSAAQITASQPLNIAVNSKYGHETIAGVSVYAVRMDDVVVAADSDNYTTLLSRYEALAAAKGTLIGTTGVDGKLTAIISQTGRYMLVAVKSGFVPGFARLTVMLAAQKALNIKSPGYIASGQTAAFTVTERYSRQTVSGAAIYAQAVTSFNMPSQGILPRPIIAAADNVSGKSKGKLATVQGAIAIQPAFNADVIKANPADNTAALKYADQVKSSGTFLGNTNDNGTLSYAFSGAGYYTLVAILDGYTPAFSRIKVGNDVEEVKHQLGIQAAKPAYVNKSVLLKVFDRKNGQAAGNVTVYGFKNMVVHPAVKPSTSSHENWTDKKIIIDNFNTDPISEKEAAELMLQSKVQPITIGVTDSNGELKYTFTEAAVYTLVAFKDGYIAGGCRVNVIKEPVTTKNHR